MWLNTWLLSATFKKNQGLGKLANETRRSTWPEVERHPRHAEGNTTAEKRNESHGKGRPPLQVLCQTREEPTGETMRNNEKRLAW